MWDTEAVSAKPSSEGRAWRARAPGRACRRPKQGSSRANGDWPWAGVPASERGGVSVLCKQWGPRRWDELPPPGPLTEVDDLERREEPVLLGQVLPGGLGAVILDEGEAAGAQDVVVGALHRPVEVREAELVVADGAVGHAEGGPVRQAPLQQVLRQHLRGAGLRAGGGARGPGPAQQQPERGLVGFPQGLHGRRAAAPAPQTPWGARRWGRGGWSAHAGPPGRAARTPTGGARARETPGAAARTSVPRPLRRERRGRGGPGDRRRVGRVSGVNKVVESSL